MRMIDARMRRWLLTPVLLGCLMGLVTTSGAETASADSAARKAGRGLAGMTVGVLEIPGNMLQTSRDRGYGWGLTLGFAEGLGRTVVRELVGVYEFLSCPFPLPAEFKPILEPEFPWGYFEQ